MLKVEHFCISLHPLRRTRFVCVTFISALVCLSSGIGLERAGLLFFFLERIFCATILQLALHVGVYVCECM